jgi:hypothetical protein
LAEPDRDDNMAAAVTFTSLLFAVVEFELFVEVKPDDIVFVDDDEDEDEDEADELREYGLWRCDNAAAALDDLAGR